MKVKLYIFYKNEYTDFLSMKFFETFFFDTKGFTALLALSTNLGMANYAP